MGRLNALCAYFAARSWAWQGPVPDEHIPRGTGLDAAPTEALVPGPSAGPASLALADVAGPAPQGPPTESDDGSRTGLCSESSLGPPPADSPPPTEGNCGQCGMPPTADAFWQSYNAADLNNRPTCDHCCRPIVPRTAEEMLRSVADTFGWLPDVFDEGRIAPRAHERALWTQRTHIGNTRIAAHHMADLLHNGRLRLILV